MSRHEYTLRAVPLTGYGCDGPVAWEIDVDPLWTLALVDRGLWAALHAGHVQGFGWLEVAREYEVQKLLPVQPWQQAILERLAEMDL